MDNINSQVAATNADDAARAAASADTSAAPATVTAPSDGHRPRVAVVTMGVKLGDETRGYTRFRFLSELLVREGFDVDLFTSSFQHWEKAQRDTARACYRNLPYRVRFIEEPGYKKNLDLARIRSHRIAAKNLRRMLGEALAHDPHAYRLIYAEIPPNDVARTCAEVAHDHGVPFVADINDLWPEAMRMAVNVPVVSDIAFHPFARDAKATYRLLSAAVGTSDEYAARPLADREAPCPTVTVYVGNDLATFDAGVAANAPRISKPAGEFWVTYAGTLGASYDIATLVEAASALNDRKSSGPTKRVRVKILGDGPDRASLEELATRRGAPVDFLGYTPYDQMAAYLSASDVTVNSLVASAPQSIVTKIGDYLASGKPLINTGSSPEFRAKVASDGFGVNVPAENVTALADAICELAANPRACADMGARGRTIAEQQFDQPKAYLKIVDLIRSLL
ncbi:glycosyltransferase family 4 protein [Adlercreutzia sp. ZJ473]|uniref:glycosyltransferase family 4 protein n=1 Tax=Adlercreutzia sp. ZJ473 TaxID=2722822 RepID=UPI0020A66A17|nr:glycosyltransferase family 4 protein [Adlercreutzia sp. ZJ473]